MIGTSGSDVIDADVVRLVRRTGPSWLPLRGARMLVTGGTGFFGTWLLNTLVAADATLALGLRITVLSRDPSRFLARHAPLAAAPALRFVAGDVRDVRLPGESFTHVVHAATEASAALERDDPETMLGVCVEGTRRVLALAGACGARRFLFTSSGAVYAPPPDGTTRFTEEMPTAAAAGGTDGAYAAGKREAERLCLAAASRGAGVTIARCFAFVGPYLPLDTHFAVGNFIRDALGGGPIVVRGDGTAVRSYLYAADLVEWLATILLRGEPGRPYNVGSEEGLSVAALGERVAGVAAALFPDRPPPRVVVQGGTAPGTAARRYLPDCTRARVELGLRQATPLDEAIERTMRFAGGLPRHAGADGSDT